MNTIDDITAICVVHNTKDLFRNAYESFRKWHPEMMIIIVDGSDFNDPCRIYIESLSSPFTTIALCQTNLGHGRGMHAGIGICKTRFALIFDSDIVMLKSPVEQMLAMMKKDTYGCGYTEKSGLDGYEYGAHQHHKNQDFMYMLHPFFHLLQISEYFKFHPYIHHGAPCFKAALDIHNRGLTDKIIKRFPGLGHTSGKGFCWLAVPGEWIIHDTAGTRKDRVHRGKQEIEQGWEY